MTKEELFNNAQYLSIKDLMRIYDCGYNVAFRIMREIKAVSDIMKVKGKVTLSDYERWYNQIDNS